MKFNLYNKRKSFLASYFISLSKRDAKSDKLKQIEQQVSSSANVATKNSNSNHCTLTLVTAIYVFQNNFFKTGY